MLTWANEWEARFDDLHNDPHLKHLYCKFYSLLVSIYQRGQAIY